MRSTICKGTTLPLRRYEEILLFEKKYWIALQDSTGVNLLYQDPNYSNGEIFCLLHHVIALPFIFF